MGLYEVALSFAGAQRDYAEAVARALQARGIAVFYDEFEQVELWGTDLVETFHEVFSERARRVVMFISRDYVERAWPRHERRSILSQAIQKDAGYVLPVRFDDTPVPGLPDSISYEDAKKRSPAELAALIAEKIGVPRFSGKAHEVPPPRMTAQTGEAVFDYSSYNGRYVIGTGALTFETKWTKASDTSIYLYNDPPSIHGVALARGCTSISSVAAAEELDYTSRVRTVRVGGVAVLRNTGGFYAALHVLDIKDDTRGHAMDELRFRYAIQADGSDSFAEFGGV